MQFSGLNRSMKLQETERAMLFGPFPPYCKTDPAQLYGMRLDDFNHNYMRWCSACLEESAYLRGEWGLKLSCVCVRHAVMLQDRCPHCRSLQRLQRAELLVCSCGFYVGRSTCAPAPTALLNLHRVLLEALTPSNEELVVIRPATWVRLVKYLGPFDDNPLARRPGQVKGLNQLSAAIALASRTANLLDDWPANFNRLLYRIRAAIPAATHIADAFGSLYHVLYRDLNEPALMFLREAFEAYLRDNWFGLLGRRNRRLRLETIAQHPHRPIHEIAQETNTGKAAICHLARMGAILGQATHHRSGRTTWAIPSAEIGRVVAYRADSLSLRQMAERLGIGRMRVRELIDAGLLRAWVSPERTGAGAWWLSRADADRLMSLVRPIGQRETSIANVQLTTVLRGWRLQRGEFPALLHALLSNEIDVAGRSASGIGLGGLLFAVPMLRVWLDSHRSKKQSWLSVDCGAKVLGLKQQVAYELIERGLLTADRLGGIRRVHCDSIVEFRTSYVSLSEIAKTHGRSPRQMLKLIAAEPVCGPAVDGARQYFFRRKDAEAALIELTHLGAKP